MIGGDDDVEGEDRSQDLGPQPAQWKCTSRCHKSRIIWEIDRKSARAQSLGANFVRACTTTFHKSHFAQKFTGEVAEPKPRRTLCASLRNRHASQHFTRATLYRNLKGKCRGPEPRRTLCASLRARNASQHFTRATLYGNLQEKCRGPD